MSHCVTLYIVKKEDGPADELVDKFPCADTGLHLLIPITDELCKYFGVNPISSICRQQCENAILSKFPNMILAETDYFGGIGDQEACVWKSKRKLVYQEEGVYDWPSISEALREIGVQKEENNQDEFEYVGLCGYRSNFDIIEEWEAKYKPKKAICDHCGSTENSCNDVESKMCDNNVMPETKVEPVMMVMHTECGSCNSKRIYFDEVWKCKDCHNEWK